jgi:hypothetical protein
VVVGGELDPPQPMLKAVTTSRIRLNEATGQMVREVNFLRRKNSGSRRNGNRINADVELATVSAKTTVT